MQLVQILLPLYNNKKEQFTANLFANVKQELTDKFGGITTYSRSPATGLWKENEDKTVKDDIIIYEVITENIDRDWWLAFKENLRQAFQQDELLVRTWAIELI